MDIDKPHLDHENDLTDLERRLSAWQPATGGLDRDRMLFDAGRAAARAEGRSRYWRLATVALVLVTVTLGELLVHERSQRLALEMARPVRRGPAELSPPSLLLTQTPAVEPLAPNSYFVLTAQLVASDLEVPGPAGNGVKPKKADPVPLTLPLRPRDFNRVLDL
jgi:hypothetical protein